VHGFVGLQQGDGDAAARWDVFASWLSPLGNGYPLPY